MRVRLPSNDIDLDTNIDIDIDINIDINIDIDIDIVIDIDLRKEFVQSLWQNLKLGKSNMSHVLQIGHIIY